eukprot:1800885-Amphidinium_carterae.1
MTAQPLSTRAGGSQSCLAQCMEAVRTVAGHVLQETQNAIEVQARFMCLKQGVPTNRKCPQDASPLQSYHTTNFHSIVLVMVYKHSKNGTKKTNEAGNLALWFNTEFQVAYESRGNPDETIFDESSQEPRVIATSKDPGIRRFQELSKI